MSGRHVSVDAPFVEGEDNSLIDVMVNEDSPNADRGLINESLSTEIDRALATLTPREADILRKFFGIKTPEKTLEEIGDELHLTRERVRQIKEKAIRKLNSGQRSHILMTYLFTVCGQVACYKNQSWADLLLDASNHLVKQLLAVVRQSTLVIQIILPSCSIVNQ